jgi:hypothetical protein
VESRDETIAHLRSEIQSHERLEDAQVSGHQGPMRVYVYVYLCSHIGVHFALSKAPLTNVLNGGEAGRCAGDMCTYVYAADFVSRR